MSSPVAELEAGLQAMLSLKPPGVTPAKVATLTTLCTANIQSESVLIQKLYTHFKKAPVTHKLGVLYVVDNLVRKWTDLARSQEQDTSNAALDGTYGAGVNRIRELMPIFITDVTKSAPSNQQEKILKLVEIWQRGQTFPAEMLKSFSDKLKGFTTPPESPGLEMRKSPDKTQAPPGPSDEAIAKSTEILAALAILAKQNTAAEIVQSTQAIADAPLLAGTNTSYSVPHLQIAAQPAPLTPYLSQLQAATNVPASLSGVSGGLLQNNGHFPQLINMSNHIAQPVVSSPEALTADLRNQILMMKILSDQGIPREKWEGTLATVNAALRQGPENFAIPGLPLLPLQSCHPTAPILTQPSWFPSGEPTRDRDVYGQHDSARMHPNQSGYRSRSRSPDRGWKHDSSTSSHRSLENSFHDDGGRGRTSADPSGWPRVNISTHHNDYRQRSPIRNGNRPRTITPPPKWMQYDSAVPNTSIKVLSRTLFVGGVGCTEQELRRICSKFGQVQTCIVNKEKRHAFVKMFDRKDAILTKEGMEKMKGVGSKFRSTRWGVGFGPRECSDFADGISIIPIGKLTDADKKWLLNAEYGGTGGKPIVGTMVVEEPDIEVGQGVSSKSISRRNGDDGRPLSRDESESSQKRDHHENLRKNSDRNNRSDRHDRKERYRQESHGPSSNPNTMPVAVFPLSTMLSRPTVPPRPEALPVPPMPPMLNGFKMPNGMPMFPPLPPFVMPALGGQFPPPPPPPGRN